MTLSEKFVKRTAPLLKTVIGHLRDITALLQPEDDWVEGFRRRAALQLHPLAASFGRPLIFEAHDEDQFLTVDVDPDTVEELLMAPGDVSYQRNLASTRKYRYVSGERQWADGSFVYDPDDTDWQHHVYIFENSDATTDVYGHKETSAEADPYGHVTERQDHGDPDGIATAKLQ